MVFDIDVGRPSRGRDVLSSNRGEEQAPTDGEVGKEILIMQGDEVVGEGCKEKKRAVGDRWEPDEEQLERLASLYRAKRSRQVEAMTSRRWPTPR